MYCVNCGVRLNDAEKRCPLCGTRVYHPDLQRPATEPLYPREWAATEPERSGLRFLLTVIFAVAACVCFLVEFSQSRTVTWSGYALGGILLAYVLLVLPIWFRRPNPVIFVPVDFLAVGLYLLYIDLMTKGGWFLSFAFPVTGIAGLLVTAVVALVRYVRRGYFFILGGALLGVGGYLMLLELFQCITFGGQMFRWCLYPTGACALLGLFFILAGVIRPLGNALRKRMFI